MKPLQLRATAAVMALGAALALSACSGASYGGSAPASKVPAHAVHAVVIPMPHGWDNVARVCTPKGDGVYSITDSSNGAVAVATIAHDPECGG